MEKSYSPHLKLAQFYWKNLLNNSSLAIDATCGNGRDTLFLAQICSVIGMDIQTSAIQNTEALLAEHQKKRLCTYCRTSKSTKSPSPVRRN